MDAARAMLLEARYWVESQVTRVTLQSLTGEWWDVGMSVAPYVTACIAALFAAMCVRSSFRLCFVSWEACDLFLHAMVAALCAAVCIAATQWLVLAADPVATTATMPPPSQPVVETPLEPAVKTLFATLRKTLAHAAGVEI